MRTCVRWTIHYMLSTIVTMLSFSDKVPVPSPYFGIAHDFQPGLRRGDCLWEWRSEGGDEGGLLSRSFILRSGATPQSNITERRSSYLKHYIATLRDVMHAQAKGWIKACAGLGVMRMMMSQTNARIDIQYPLAISSKHGVVERRWDMLASQDRRVKKQRTR